MSSETPRTDAARISCWGEGGIEHSLGFTAVPVAHARQLERELSAAKAETEAAAGAVLNNLPYLENLIILAGHESVLLRNHPAPCKGHDFCLMRQAQKGADAIRAAFPEIFKEPK